MQINSYNSKQNFTGVRLSSNSMRCVKDAVNTLKKTGFDFIGKQIVFCDNTMEAKMGFKRKRGQNRPLFLLNVLFDGVNGAFFQTGHLSLGDTNLGGDLHLGFPLIEPQG